MSGPIAANDAKRSGALAEIARVRSAFVATCEGLKSSSISPRDLFSADSCRANSGVSVLKSLECVPGLGKTGARAVIAAAGISFMTTFDDLSADACAQLAGIVSERGATN